MSKTKFTLDAWFSSPVGHELLKAEARGLAAIIGSKWGDHLVQIGGPRAKTLRAVSPIIHQVCLSESGGAFEDASSMQLNYQELALQPNSVDLILLPHLLEAARNPEELLKEIYQALKPEGVLVILSFNTAGLGLFWRINLVRQRILRHAKWWSTYRIMEVLQVVGFGEIDRYSVCFRLPGAKVPSKKAWWEKLLAWLCPQAGAVSILCVKKEEFAPLMPVEWLAKPSLAVLQNQRYE